MCLAVPLKLIEINGSDAVGEAMGMKRAVRVDFIQNPKIGDYVMVHAGMAIAKIDGDDETQADDIMNELEDLL